MTSWLRRLRGVIGNAFVWGVAWFLAGFLYVAAIYLVQIGPTHYSQLFIRDALGFASELAMVGFLTGGSFSLYVVAVFRRQQLQQVSSGRFALGGTLVGVLLAVVVLTVVAVSSSSGPALLSALVTPVLISGILGGITALGTLKVARAGLIQDSEPMARLNSEPPVRSGIRPQSQERPNKR